MPLKSLPGCGAPWQVHEMLCAGEPGHAGHAGQVHWTLAEPHRKASTCDAQRIKATQ